MGAELRKSDVESDTESQRGQARLLDGYAYSCTEQHALTSSGVHL
jgi:hypothetical protein